ncbi:SDR family oxidoreductase [Dermatobacter hominis]|uniref:SDR family oxidoreductase n=1 Tax=Dermatobacter hominis TaxID=2884263 RepID=UPI001D124153|nr:SDR family oxidoreductase [Dermatobacter hominis]
MCPTEQPSNPPVEPKRKVTVVGSTGLVGSQLVALLTAAGHDIVEVSQSSRFDVLTGEGLDEALAGVDVVIDVVNSATPDDSAEAFFEQTSANLAAAAGAAGVGHYVVLSIVGADELAGVAGYMRGKLAQETAAEHSGVPWTVVRSTQFHELAEPITESLIDGDEVRAPDAHIQTIASAELAAVLVRVAIGEPLNTIHEVGGPRKMTFSDMARAVLAHQGRGLAVIDTTPPTYFGLPINDTTLVAGDHAEHGTIPLTDWLARS